VAVAATGAFPGFPKKGKVGEVVVPQRVSQGDGCGDGKKETQTLATISSHPLGCGLLALGCWLLAGGSWVFCLWFLGKSRGKDRGLPQNLRKFLVVLPQLVQIAAKGPGRQPVAHFMATGATRDSDSELDEDVWLPFLWASMCVWLHGESRSLRRCDDIINAPLEESRLQTQMLPPATCHLPNKSLA